MHYYLFTSVVTHKEKPRKSVVLLIGGKNLLIGRLVSTEVCQMELQKLKITN